MESFLTTVAALIREKQLPALLIEGNAVTALDDPEFSAIVLKHGEVIAIGRIWAALASGS